MVYPWHPLEDLHFTFYLSLMRNISIIVTDIPVQRCKLYVFSKLLKYLRECIWLLKLTNVK